MRAARSMARPVVGVLGFVGLAAVIVVLGTCAKFERKMVTAEGGASAAKAAAPAEQELDEDKPEPTPSTAAAKPTDEVVVLGDRMGAPPAGAPATGTTVRSGELTLLLGGQPAAPPPPRELEGRKKDGPTGQEELIILPMAMGTAAGDTTETLRAPAKPKPSPDKGIVAFEQDDRPARRGPPSASQTLAKLEEAEKDADVPEEAEKATEVTKEESGKQFADGKARFRTRDTRRNHRGEPQAGGEGFDQDGEGEDGQDGFLDLRTVRPAAFLPRVFYFENTYLGGNAGYLEQLRRLDAALADAGRPYRAAALPPQAFDPPDNAGLGLTAQLDTRSFETSGRVLLQVGLTGSERYGWRRPPLDIALVLDAPALAGGSDAATAIVAELLRQLGPQDRLGVFVAGRETEELAALGRRRALVTLLPPQLEALRAPAPGDDGALGAAMGVAGGRLEAAAMDASSVPGTQTVLVVTRASAPSRAAAATAAAHELALHGVVTSVVELEAVGSADTTGLWQVASAGNGNYHRVASGEVPAAAVQEELATLSRVVARLLRLNIRLGKGVEAIRVLGSRVLDEEEARQVKAREVATDRQLSKTLGIASDRGEDSDGIQTVIPYFYGGDSHVVLVELWVEEPGAIAEVSLQYKDMVTLRNASAQAAVALRATSRPTTDEQLAIRRNARGFELGAALERAGHRVRHGDASGALAALAEAESLAARTSSTDRRLVASLRDLVAGGTWQGGGSRQEAVSEALVLAGRRRVGQASE